MVVEPWDLTPIPDGAEVFYVVPGTRHYSINRATVNFSYRCSNGDTMYDLCEDGVHSNVSTDPTTLEFV
jgi:hypothetical protein